MMDWNHTSTSPIVEKKLLLADTSDAHEEEGEGFEFVSLVNNGFRQYTLTNTVNQSVSQRSVDWIFSVNQHCVFKDNDKDTIDSTEAMFF